MGHYCFACWRLSSSVILPAGGRSGGRHSTAGQYGYITSGRHLVSHVTPVHCERTLQEMPPGLKEKNAHPRAVGDPANKAMKKRLLAMSDDSSTSRLAHTGAASNHIRQLMDVAIARVHKRRAFTDLFQRLPPITARATNRLTAQLDSRRQQCFLTAPEQPPVCRGGSRVWKKRAY